MIAIYSVHLDLQSTQWQTVVILATAVVFHVADQEKMTVSVVNLQKQIWLGQFVTGLAKKVNLFQKYQAITVKPVWIIAKPARAWKNVQDAHLGI